MPDRRSDLRAALHRLDGPAVVAAALTEDPDRWLRVDSQAARARETFISTVTDPARVRRLDEALAGRPPFRRFRGTLAAWPDEEYR